MDQNVVFIVDDDEAVARSLRRVITSTGSEARAFTDAEEFLASYGGEPGCLLLDVRMPGMGGLELQERLNEAGVDLPIVFMSGHGDVSTACTALRKGAVDFLEKPFREEALLECVEEALARQSERALVRKRRAERDELLGKLTAREREVLAALVAGRTVKEIAFELGLSHKTVQVHRSNIMEKTEARSVVELTRLSLLPDEL